MIGPCFARKPWQHFVSKELAMSKYPNAIWKPVTSRTMAPFRSGPLGLIIHISNSRGNTIDGLWSTFMSSKVPSHFGIERNGRVGQFIDTDHHDWAQENTISYFSVENSASPGDELTDSQLVAVSSLYAWLSDNHGIPVRIATSAGDPGLAYHALFPPTGHPNCPGPAVVAQRPKIIQLTNYILKYNASPPPELLAS